MAQWVTVLASSLAEGLGPVPSIPMVAHHRLQLKFRVFRDHFWLPWALHSCGALTYMQAKHVYT